MGQAWFMKACDLMITNNLDIKLRNVGTSTSPSLQLISVIKSSLAKEMSDVEPTLVCLGEKNKRELAEIRSCINMTDHYVSCGLDVGDLDCDHSARVLWE